MKDHHLLLGTCETAITYRLDPIAAGTRVTVRDEGFIGRSEAAYGNAEHWERILGGLDVYSRSDALRPSPSRNGSENHAHRTCYIETTPDRPYEAIVENTASYRLTKGGSSCR
jgi:hypothetical protein